MKKILVIHHSSIIGGAGISLFNLLEQIKYDYDITVYVSNLHDDYYNFLTENNIKVKKYSGRIPAIYYHASSNGIMSVSFWHRLLLLMTKYRFWKKTINNSNADLVIVNSLILCWISFLLKGKKTKSICFVRETFANKGKGFITKAQRKLLSMFTGVSFISNYDLKVAKLPSNVKTFINHNYLIPKKGNEHEKDKENVFSVLYLGGISKIKGIEVIIKAAYLLKDKEDIHFNILGEDYSDTSSFKLKNILNKNLKLSRKIKKRVKNNGLEKTVTFYGIQKKTQSFFESNDVLTCPIITPHQQRGVFEAGWYSMPVIVSNFEQLYWAVGEEENGLFFEANNANDLAQKILRIYNDKNLCKNLGVENNKRTLKNHTLEQCNNKLVAMLKCIIDEERK